MKNLPLLLVGMLLCMLPVASAESSKKPLKVGIISALSGPYGLYGQAGRVGFELGLEDAGAGARIKTIFEDDQYTGAKSVTAFQRLNDIEAVDVFIVLGTPGGAAIAPLSDRVRKPIFVWTPLPRVASNRAWMLRLMPSGDVQGEVSAKEVQRYGYRRVGYVNATNEFAQSNVAGFLKSFSGKPDILEEFNPDDHDFRAFLTRLSHLNVEALGLCLNVPQISVFARQARQLGYRGVFFGCNSLSSDEVLRSAANELDGAWYVEGRIREEFLRRFSEKNRDTGGVWLGAAFYDVARILAEATRAPGAFSMDDVVQSTVGRCLKDSAFEENCIREVNGERFFDTKLRLTFIRGGKFIRGE